MTGSSIICATIAASKTASAFVAAMTTELYAQAVRVDGYTLCDRPRSRSKLG